MTNEPILLACKIAGSKSALATAIGVKPPTVQQWVNGDRPIPPVRCVSIEKFTDGRVTRKMLRPADWSLIWPELGKAA